jgi:7-cyano-7-deazaguanine synthase in queuosine biosynthesis
MPEKGSTKKHVVLNSGGPDSFITYFALKRSFPDDEVISLYFDLNHRYGLQEKIAVAKTIPNTVYSRAMNGIWVWEEADAHIHLRNIFLILAATKDFKENTTIYLSVQKDEMDIPDRRPLTLAAVNSLFNILGIDAKVKSLWNDKDKTEMVEYYVSSGGDLSLLFKTWSCYSPVRVDFGTVHCGDCPACIRRHIAFVLGAGYDNTEYKTDPTKSKTADIYRERANSGLYSKDRCGRILSVLK